MLRFVMSAFLMFGFVSAHANAAHVNSPATSAAHWGQYVYLGNAYSLPHCKQIALVAGYRWAAFGGFVNGRYQWNACFGAGQMGGGPSYPTVISGYDFNGYRTCYPLAYGRGCPNIANPVVDACLNLGGNPYYCSDCQVLCNRPVY